MALIRNLVVLKHATKLTFTTRHISRLKRIKRRSHRMQIDTLALKVTVGVDARRRRMTAVRLVDALIDIDTIVVFHLVAGLAFAIIPEIKLIFVK